MRARQLGPSDRPNPRSLTGALPEWFLCDEPPPSRRDEWLVFGAVSAAVLGMLAFVSPMLALLVGGLAVGAWGLLWLFIHVGGRLTLWGLGVAADVGARALDGAFAGPRNECETLAANQRRRGQLLRARYPERYEADLRQTAYRYGPDYDVEAEVREIWALHEALVHSSRPFLKALREGNSRYAWYDAEGLLQEEREVMRMRQDLIKSLGPEARRRRAVRRSPG